MADRLSKEHRSWNMSRIRSKDTKPELILRLLLHRAGFRYRLHDKRLPGKPDIVMARYRTVIFVNGCYWHRHRGCPQATTPKTNTAFWQKKFNETVRRDERKTAELIKFGWSVIVVWECELQKNPVGFVEGLGRQLKEGCNG
ncbi:MAG: DNA mismatch endonuclease Vsr [Alphaproteobacteria bacterium]|nr:DNA mismatch endonuclease Vsr [Alphaproteobacteria bacterium]